MKKITVKSTVEGKLYYDTWDFFNDPKVKNTVKSIMTSQIFKKILTKKNKI